MPAATQLAADAECWAALATALHIANLTLLQMWLPSCVTLLAGLLCEAPSELLSGVMLPAELLCEAPLRGSVPSLPCNA